MIQRYNHFFLLCSFGLLLLCGSGCGVLDEALIDPIPCQSSNSCPADVPICDTARGVCAPCDQVADLPRADAECRARGLGMRCAAGQTFDQPGRCMACRTAMDCNPDKGCWHGICVASCQKDLQCVDSGVCLSVPSLSAGTDAIPGQGLCVPKEEVLSVGITQRACVSYPNQEGIYCTLNAAIGRLNQQFADADTRLLALSTRASVGPSDYRRIIHVLPGIYGSLDLSPARVSRAKVAISMYGGDDPANRPQIVEGHGVAPSVLIGPEIEVTLDGFDIGLGSTGIDCQGSTLIVRRSTVSAADAVGIQTDGCQLTLDRVKVKNSKGGALSLMGQATYHITNSVFVGNSSVYQPILVFDAGTDGVFRFNTVANNSSNFAGTLSCADVAIGNSETPGARRIENSIFALNPLGQGRHSQVSGNCQLDHVVVGSADPYPGGTRMDPLFVSDSQDFHLRPGQANDSCCIDQVHPSPVDTETMDFDSRPRPNGPGSDIGAYEFYPH